MSDGCLHLCGHLLLFQRHTEVWTAWPCHTVRVDVCACGTRGCVSTRQQRNENEKTANPRLIHIHSVALIGEGVRGVREPCLSCQDKHLCIQLSLTLGVVSSALTPPPATHWSELADWNGKQTEPKRSEWLQVCVCERVCAGSCGLEEKSTRKAVFTLARLDKNVGGVFFNVHEREVHTVAGPITFSRYSKDSGTVSCSALLPVAPPPVRMGQQKYESW